MSKTFIKALIVLLCLIPNLVLALNTGNAWVLCFGDNGHIAIEAKHEEISALSESNCIVHELPSQDNITHEICHEKQSCNDVLIADGRTLLETSIYSIGITVVRNPELIHEVVDTENANLAAIRIQSIPPQGQRAILAQLSSVILII